MRSNEKVEIREIKRDHQERRDGERCASVDHDGPAPPQEAFQVSKRPLASPRAAEQENMLVSIQTKTVRRE